ncbi:PREDICTED: uncharacterized protein LOC104733925 [Camelina sativa]|uniref:Uncharacterized protein LOC104733925 n=1 Tax=Camelina sativa TaxID=90675 RepID=A0ABM1QR24_CAMSA|nr:PREDICTED: uncharacterized protein LOC104733925 [Camelina sativa]
MEEIDEERIETNEGTETSGQGGTNVLAETAEGDRDPNPSDSDQEEYLKVTKILSNDEEGIPTLIVEEKRRPREVPRERTRTEPVPAPVPAPESGENEQEIENQRDAARRRGQWDPMILEVEINNEMLMRRLSVTETMPENEPEDVVGTEPRMKREQEGRDEKTEDGTREVGGEPEEDHVMTTGSEPRNGQSNEADSEPGVDQEMAPDQGLGEQEEEVDQGLRDSMMELVEKLAEEVRLRKQVVRMQHGQGSEKRSKYLEEGVTPTRHEEMRPLRGMPRTRAQARKRVTYPSRVHKKHYGV